MVSEILSRFRAYRGTCIVSMPERADQNTAAEEQKCQQSRSPLITLHTVLSDKYLTGLLRRQFGGVRRARGAENGFGVIRLFGAVVGHQGVSISGSVQVGLRTGKQIKY